MKQHLSDMSKMIRELYSAGRILTEEQQVQEVICSLPGSWEHMKVNVTQNESIKTFNDVARHVELEDERLGDAKIQGQAFVAEPNSRKALGSKKKGFWKKNKKWKDFEPKPKRNKKKGKQFGKKRDMSKGKCYNCKKIGHFACDCSEPKKVTPIPTSLHMVCVSSTILLTKSCPLWIVDSGAIDHVAKDRGAFVEYRRIPTSSKWIYVGNNSTVEVKGITCKLDFVW